jgi:hypothetical protein
MVMLQLSTPKDLYLTIYASLPCYRTFLTHKSLILSTVIQRAIPPEVIPDALAACDASEVATLVAQSAKLDRSTVESQWQGQTFDASVLMAAEDFVRTYPLRLKEPHPRTLTLSMSVCLCRLWAITDFFLLRYSERALRTLCTYLEKWQTPMCSVCVDPSWSHEKGLSNTERGRLQRAFFRFETYRKLFAPGLNDSRLSRQMAKTSLPHLYFEMFSSWQREEIACVHDYLLEEMECQFDELEDTFVESLQKAALEDEKPRSGSCEGRSGEDETSSPSLDSSETDSTSNTKFTSLNMLDWYGFDMFTKSDKPANHSYQIKLMVALGLPFVKRFFALETKDRMAVAGSYTMDRYRPSLDEIIDSSLFAPDPDGSSPATETAIHIDTLKDSTVGWSWIRKSSSRIRYRCCKPLDIALRGMGYIFWDQERLQEAGILDRPKDDMKLVVVPNARDRTLTAAERLEGVQIRVSALREQMSDGEPPEILGDYEY